MVSDCLGCNFPAYPFENQAETEGFGRMANRMGYQVIGLPNYVPILFFQYPSRLTYVRWSGILILRRKRTIKPPLPVHRVRTAGVRHKILAYDWHQTSDMVGNICCVLQLALTVWCTISKSGEMGGPDRIYTTCHHWISTLILAEWDCRNVFLT